MTNHFYAAPNADKNQDFLETNFMLEIREHLTYRRLKVSNNLDWTEVKIPEEVYGANAWVHSDLTDGHYPVKIKITGRKIVNNKMKAKVQFFQIDESGYDAPSNEWTDAWIHAIPA